MYQGAVNEAWLACLRITFDPNFQPLQIKALLSTSQKNTRTLRTYTGGDRSQVATEPAATSERAVAGDAGRVACQHSLSS